MIEIKIIANKEEVFDNVRKKDVALVEVAIVIHRLELIKKELLELEFDGVDIQTDDNSEAKP